MTFKALFHPQKHDTLLSNKKEKLRKKIIVTVVGFVCVSENINVTDKIFCSNLLSLCNTNSFSD